jgi:hypothetical protein
MRRHIVIPDTQVKPGLSVKHLVAAGRYIAHWKPDVVVHLGDHWDFSSLCSYEGGAFHEGRRLQHDIDAGNDALAALTKEILKPKGYKPRLVLLRGNHEDRLSRLLAADAKLDGVVGFKLLRDKELGWEVYDYLVPVKIDGVLYSHYFYAPNTGRCYGGSAAYKLAKIHASFTMGHQQGLDVAQLSLAGNRRIRGLVAGSFYQHEEGYRGPQATNEWRGIVVKHEVANGDYDLMEVSMAYLLRKWA